MNNKKCVDIIYINFSKAFDVVSHEKLLFKLKSYGISNKIIKWFYNFVSQIKRVENSFSNSSIVKYKHNGELSFKLVNKLYLQYQFT